MAFIHVVIPCYNVEQYLEQAVRSVLDQPCKDIDIILVDDGAPGRTPQLCEELAAKEPRIHVIHRENGGVSAARNTGIEFVLERYAGDLSGRYFAFLDGDDCWETELLDGKVLDTLGQGYSLVGFQSCTCSRSMKQTAPPRQLRPGVFPGGVNSVWLHSSQHFGAMFYSCDLLHRYGIRFRAGLRYSEDKIFSMQCMYLADSIYLESRLMYLYRVTASSAMGMRKFGISYYQPILEAYLESDRKMEAWADEKRGRLFAGRLAANRYAMHMIEEHYLTWGSRRALDDFFAEHPELLDVVAGTGAYGMLKPEPRYLQYVQKPRKFIVRQYVRGLQFGGKQLLRRILKLFVRN